MQLEENHKNRNLDSTPNNLRTKKKEKKKRSVQQYRNYTTREKREIRKPFELPFKRYVF